MKAEMKAVVASLVVIALALTAVSGVTYSWFSDTEEADINVTTAVVKYDTQFEVSKVTGTTSVAIDAGSDGTFSVPSLTPADKINVKTTVTNSSTCATVYRVYVLINDIAPSADTKIPVDEVKKITVINNLTAVETAFAGFGIPAFVQDWKSVATGDAVAIPEVTIDPSNLTNAAMGKTFQFKVVVEVYQGNYTIPETTTVSGGSISETPVSIGYTGKEAKVTVSGLPDSANGKDLNLSIIKDSDDITLSASISGITSFAAPVTVKMVLPGTYGSGSTVIYLGTSGEQPSDVTFSSNEDGTTTIEFKTVHFSEFMVTSNDVVAIADTVSGVGVYSSLQDAFENVVSGGNVVLVRSASVSEPILISKNVNVNLNGNNISGEDSRVFNIWGGIVSIDGKGNIESTGIASNSSVICLDSDMGDMTLTIGKDVIVKTDVCYGIAVFGAKNTNLVLYGTVESKDSSAISGNGSVGNKNTDIVIMESGKVTSTGCPAIYHPQAGKLTVYGTVDGGIEAKAGEIHIESGATIKSNGSTSHEPNGNGTSTNGYAVAIVLNDAYNGPAEDFISNGVTIEGTVAFLDDTVAGTEMVAQISDYYVFATLALAMEYAPVGSTVVLLKDIDLKLTVSVKSMLTLDLNGKKIYNTDDLWDVPNTEACNWSLISVKENGNLIIVGDGKLETKANDCYAVDVQDGAVCTIKGGEYIGNIHAAYVQKGQLFVEGGKFSVLQKYPQTGKEDEFVLNCYDANHADGTAKITVSGGEFVNFNPGNCYAEGANTNFLKDGYTTEHSGNIFKVIPKASSEA